MKQMIESFVTVFLVLIAVLVLTQFIGASMQIRGARQFHTSCIGEIESSDFDTRVIEDCRQKASEQGYELTVGQQVEQTLLCRECNGVIQKDTMTCAACGKNGTGVYATDRQCDVTLKYQVRMMFANVQEEGVLHGYAR